MASGYSVINSLSPMMFRKKKKQEQEGGTRNERMRSKSVENLIDTVPPTIRQKRSGTSPHAGKQRLPPWKEISAVKSNSPPITCILPASSLDFVASALLAVGAVPLITEGNHQNGVCMFNTIYRQIKCLAAAVD